MSKQYILEIYLPNNPGLDTFVVLESDTPFMAINKGDLINPRTFENNDFKHTILRVTGLEHFIWKADSIIKHKIGVFTEEVLDRAEYRPTGDLNPRD